MLTKQEIFDIVSTHLLNQNKTSMNADETCMYRSSNGLKCAVGALIPDDLYSPDIECITISDIISNTNNHDILRNVLYQANIDTSDLSILEFLKILQQIHDFDDPNEWKSKLKRLAKSENLITNF